MRSAKAPPKRGDNFVEVPPNAAKTLHALREMGYDSFASIMDLIDNSIDAGAKRVVVTIREVGKKNPVIDIADDGAGMDEDTLGQALRLGSDTERTTKHLGKYGMGLVTASIAMARNVWVLTRQEGKTGYEATFDLDDVERQDKFVIRLHAARSEKVLELVGDHGTLVRLSQIDRINDTNPQRFAANLRRRLGEVYRNFIRDGLSISVNHRNVEATDPLMRDHELTEVVLDQQFDLGQKAHAHLTVVELPELGQRENTDADLTQMNNGFYVVRNGRQIMEAQTFGIVPRHHSYSHFRAELSFSGELDELFHVDVKKQTIQPDDRLIERLKDKTARLIAESGRRGRERAEPVRLTHSIAQEAIGRVVAPRGKAEDENGKHEPVPGIQFMEEDKGEKGRFYQVHAEEDGPMTVTYNSAHPFIRLVAESKGSRASAAILDFMAFALARVEMEMGPEAKKVINRVCDELKEVVRTVVPPAPRRQAESVGAA